MKPIKNVTIKAIAQSADCSISVASRALNNSGYVAKEKKKRILEIAEQLGYTNSPLSIAYRENRTKQLLFFGGDLTSAYFNQMYHGMARTAQERGYNVLAINEKKDFNIVKNLLVDGVLFAMESIAVDYLDSVGKNYWLPAVTPSFVPSIAFFRSIPSVIIDNNKIINLGIDYLIKKGHKDIGIVIPYYEGYAKMRTIAWRERMMSDFGHVNMDFLINIHDEDMVTDTYADKAEYYKCENDGFSYYDAFSMGRIAAMRFCRLTKKPSALICYNDDMAFGMIAALKNEGLKIPSDLSVLGIDGIYLRHRFEPLLTTIGIFPDVQGKKCADILINMIEGKKHKYLYYSKYGILEGHTISEIK